MSVERRHSQENIHPIKSNERGNSQAHCQPFFATCNLKDLINISTNTALPADSQVIKRDSIGCEMYRDFVTLRILPVLGPVRGISLWAKTSKKKPVTLFNATEPVQCRMKQKVIELRGRERLVDPVSFNSAETTRDHELRGSHWGV